MADVHCGLFRLSAKLLVSGSEDQTVKVWKVPAEVKQNDEQVVTLHSSATVWAHQDDINCVAVSPNDQYLATASKDKTAKVSCKLCSRGEGVGESGGSTALVCVMKLFCCCSSFNLMY